MKAFRLFLLFTIFLFSFLLLAPKSALAVVTLTKFTATPGDGQILVEWETATEFDNAGFYLSRSENETSDFVRITDFIPSEGLGLTGGEYSFLDTDVENGTTYYYILEAVDRNQSIETYGPISATAGIPTPTTTSPPPTLTHTPDLTSSQTPSPSPTLSPTTNQSAKTNTPTPQVTPTKTPTRTTKPTNTNTVVYQTSTMPTASPTETQTPTITPTATLQPLPEIVIELPTQPSQSKTNTPAVSSTNSISRDDKPQTSRFSFSSLGSVIIIILVIILWMIIVGGIYFFWFKRKTQDHES